MSFQQTFRIARPPEDVFAFMVEPANLSKWQTIKTHVTPLTEGPPRLGYRVREGNRVGPRRWEQIVEFTEFETGRVLGVHVVEGPKSRGRWSLRADGDGTVVDFWAEVEAPKLLRPLADALGRRQFRGYHENLRNALEG